MQRYIVRRLLWMVVTLIGVSIIAFLILFVVPADPARTLAGEKASAETIALIRRELGLDDPLYLQYLRFAKKAVKLDFGYSYRTNEKVLPRILERFPATIKLAFAGLAVALLLGLPLGTLSALKKGTVFDHLEAVFSFIILSTPRFWLGIILIFVFAFKLGWFPIGKAGTFLHLVLPALTLGLGVVPYYSRMLRGEILEVQTKDFVKVAKAKGLSFFRILWRHILRNCWLPIITMIGMDLGVFLSGAVITETVFSWPGVGLLAAESIFNLDVPVVMGVVMCCALIVITSNFLIDISYALLDPRIKYT